MGGDVAFARTWLSRMCSDRPAKCIFLSTSVRLYQALEAAGNYSKLDVYEGMWYVFQTSPSPETEVSLKKISAFLHKHFTKEA